MNDEKVEVNKKKSYKHGILRADKAIYTYINTNKHTYS